MNDHLERYPASDPARQPGGEGARSGESERGAVLNSGGGESAPGEFRVSKLTWITLCCLTLLLPALNFIGADDAGAMLKLLAEHPISLFYIPTIGFLWLIFAMVYATLWRENQSLVSIGFTKFRPLFVFQAMAFFMVSILILKGLELVLANLGYEITGELGLILPRTTAERIWWVALSFSAGFCEEAAFRGYVMTRLRRFTPESWGSAARWIPAVVISSLAFGIGHNYQGLAGVIIITIYGALFAMLFILTRSIWPGVIAHFFTDFLNLFIPLFESGS